MRQDKTVTRILLVLFVVNVALAAPAIVRQRHLDVAEAAPEKRAGSVWEDEPLDKLAGGSVSDQMPDLGSSRHLSDSGSSGYLSDPTDFGSENYLALDSPQETPPGSPHPSLSGYEASDDDSGWSELDDDRAPVRLSEQVSEVSPPHDWPYVSPAVSFHDGPRPVFVTNLYPPPRNWRLHGQDSESPAGSSVGSMPKLASDSDEPSLQDSAPESSATANRVFNNGFRGKVYSAWGAVSAGVIFGLKRIKDMISPRAYVSPLFPSHSCRHLTESQIF